AADSVRAEMREQGVDFVNDADAFARVDEAYKVADAHRDAVAELRVREGRLLEIVGERADAPRPSVERAEARGIAARFVESPEYQALKRWKVLEMTQARVESAPVEAVTRDELRDGLRMRTTVDNTAGSGGGRIWSDRLESFLVEKPVRAVRLTDLFTTGTT